METGISVIICCYNSAQLLPETLGCLAAQVNTAGIPWELILVNNNSTDDTEKVAATAFSGPKLEGKGRIVPESEPGLINARIRGLKEARYSVLLFCDDDNRLDDNYLENAWRIMTSHPEIGACGGIGIPEFESGEKPEWFTPALEGAFALGAQSSGKEGRIDAHLRYLYGAGLLIRKKVFSPVATEAVGLILTGRKGQMVLAGDDSEIAVMVVAQGYELWYSEALRFRHFLQAKRLNLNYVNTMYQGFGQGTPVLNLYYSEQELASGYRNLFFGNWLGHVLLQGAIAGKYWLKSRKSSRFRFNYVLEKAAFLSAIRLRPEFAGIKRTIAGNLAAVKKAALENVATGKTRL